LKEECGNCGDDQAVPGFAQSEIANLKLMGCRRRLGELILDKFAPDFIWLPDGVEVAFGFGHTHTLARNAIARAPFKIAKCQRAIADPPLPSTGSQAFRPVDPA
jgi:hypothetical protein